MKIREDLTDWIDKLTRDDATLNKHMVDGNINPDNFLSG